MTELIGAIRKSQLASTVSGGEGASLVGTDSKANLGASTTVEAALTWLNTFVTTVATTSGLNESIDDRVNALIVEGSGISKSYDDSGNLLTLSITISAGMLPTGIDAAKIADGSVNNTKFQYLNGVTSSIQTQIDGKAASSHSHAVGDITGLVEFIQDTVGAFTVAGSGATVTYDDVANMITIATSGGGGGSTDADDIDAGTLDVEFGGTGADLSAAGPGIVVQDVTGNPFSVRALTGSDLPSNIDAAKIADGSVNNTKFQYLSTLSSNVQTQIDGKAASSHTHTASNITDFSEAVDDRVSTLIVAGVGISASYNDGSNTLTISAGAAINSLTYADPLVIAAAGDHKVTLTGSPEVQISGPTAGQIVRIRFLQDGTGGFNPTWDDAMTIKWAGGSPPTITSAANKATWIGLKCTGTDAYDGFVLSANH